MPAMPPALNVPLTPLEARYLAALRRLEAAGERTRPADVARAAGLNPMTAWQISNRLKGYRPA